ncbi:MAG TPA: VOC family protein [Flavobacterium sp.]|nr:VOC family protein [Flavobacterium sp.]
MALFQRITPNLWFDNEAEEAASHYASIFQDSKINKVSRYGKEGFEFHRKPEGTAMVVEFELDGQKFLALNGGRSLSLLKRSLSSSAAKPKMKSTISGTGCLKAATPMRSSAAG